MSFESGQWRFTVSSFSKFKVSRDFTEMICGYSARVKRRTLPRSRDKFQKSFWIALMTLLDDSWFSVSFDWIFSIQLMIRWWSSVSCIRIKNYFLIYENLRIVALRRKILNRWQYLMNDDSKLRCWIILTEIWEVKEKKVRKKKSGGRKRSRYEILTRVYYLKIRYHEKSWIENSRLTLRYCIFNDSFLTSFQ